MTVAAAAAAAAVTVVCYVALRRMMVGLDEPSHVWGEQIHLHPMQRVADKVHHPRGEGAAVAETTIKQYIINSYDRRR